MVPGDYSESIDSNPDPYIGTANIKQIKVPALAYQISLALFFICYLI